MAIATGTAIALGIAGSVGTGIYNTRTAAKQNDAERATAVSEADRDRQLMREEAERREKARQEAYALYKSQYDDYIEAMRPQWALADQVLQTLQDGAGGSPLSMTPPAGLTAAAGPMASGQPPAAIAGLPAARGGPPPTGGPGALMPLGAMGGAPPPGATRGASRFPRNRQMAPQQGGVPLMDLVQWARLAREGAPGMQGMPGGQAGPF